MAWSWLQEGRVLTWQLDGVPAVQDRTVTHLRCPTGCTLLCDDNLGLTTDGLPFRACPATAGPGLIQVLALMFLPHGCLDAMN
jgi:hypothetical protein